MADIKELCRELAELLLREERCLEEATTALKRDRQALASARGSLLEEANRSWTELAAGRSDLDRRRAMLIDRISRETGLEPRAIRVSRLARLVGEPEAGALRRAGERVRRAAREAALQAAIGHDLLEEATRFQEGLIARLAGAAEPVPGHYGYSRETGSAPLSVIDRTG